MTQTWSAPTATGPVRATVEVPGSKSITNRALILSALADGPSSIRGALLARDTELMIDALRALGVGIAQTGSRLDVVPGRLQGPATIDCGLAGTIMRFLPPLACLATGDVRIDGDPRARERPMGGLLDALAQLGARIDATGGRLPLVVRGTGRLAGGGAAVDASASSQFVSGLLLSAARFDEGMVLTTSRPVPSQPHIDMTSTMLAEHGVTVTQSVAAGRRVWSVPAAPIAARDRDVEPDLSNALPFLAAAMATGGEVTVPGWPARTTQPGGRLPQLLAAMGGDCELTPSGLTVRGPTRLSGLAADLSEVGELTPVLAALSALAATPSHLRGIGHLRGHETDRLAALTAELGTLGARVREDPDGLRIEPARLHGGRFATYHDHRMATAAAVIGLVIPGVLVQDVATTAKTLPGFVRLWQAMLGGEPA